jgi:hypothetical protein
MLAFVALIKVFAAEASGSEGFLTALIVGGLKGVDLALARSAAAAPVDHHDDIGYLELDHDPAGKEDGLKNFELIIRLCRLHRQHSASWFFSRPLFILIISGGVIESGMLALIMTFFGPRFEEGIAFFFRVFPTEFFFANLQLSN